jgi:hypothetical protein
MTDDRLSELLDTLLEATTQGKISWKVSEVNEDWYEYESPNAVVGVGSRDGDRQAPFQVILYDHSDNVVADLVDDDNLSVNAAMRGVIRLLYRGAKRNARGVDTLAQTLIDEIRST